jgi:hypothetical protein
VNKRAIALDPSLQSYAGLSIADITLIQWLLVSAMRSRASRRGAERQRRRPSNSSRTEARWRAGRALWLGRRDRCSQSFRRATTLSPDLRDTWYWYARFLFRCSICGRGAGVQSARRNPDLRCATLQAMPYERMGDPGRNPASKRALAAADRVLNNSPDVRRSTRQVR